MKGLAALSLLLNVALAATILWLVQQSPSRPQTPDAPAANTKVEVKRALTNAAVASTPTVTSDSAKPVQSFDWRMVESDDYKKYIANLRAIGCPEETIRDIIIADVNKLFESRRRALTTSTNKFQYWKAGNIFGDMMDPDRMEKNQELTKEKRALLKELLGVEPEEKADMFAGVNPFETMLDFLSPTQQNQVMEVYMKYQAKIAKLAGGGAMDADDMKEMRKVQKEMDAELAKMLSPQEFEDYQLRMSQTAMTMRMQMASFDASEQEFRDIFKIKKAYDDEYGYGANDKAEQEKANAAARERDPKLKEVLGDKRAAEYERSQDYYYQSAYRVTEKYGLSKDVANKVYEMRKEAQQESRKIRADSSLTPEQRDEALKGIRTETDNAMKTVMGDKAFESYQSSHGASY